MVDEFGTSIPVVLSNDNYPDFLWYYIRHISEKVKDVLDSERSRMKLLQEQNTKHFKLNIEDN